MGNPLAPFDAVLKRYRTGIRSQRTITGVELIAISKVLHGSIQPGWVETDEEWACAQVASTGYDFDKAAYDGE
jgi:hypothetical protein